MVTSGISGLNGSHPGGMADPVYGSWPITLICKSDGAQFSLSSAAEEREQGRGGYGTMV